MQFSDTSNLTGIVEHIDFFCETDSTSYPLKDKARNVNRHYYDIVNEFLKSNHRWQYDDSNQSGLPSSTDNLVDSQETYSIPSVALKLLGIEVLDSAGNAVKLEPISKRDLAVAEQAFLNQDGLPKYYIQYGLGKVKLFPAPKAADVTLTAGIRFYYAREIDIFVSTDTTQEPGIPEQFHHYMVHGASYDWFVRQGENEKAQFHLVKMTEMKRDVRKYHANEADSLRIRPAHRTFKYQ